MFLRNYNIGARLLAGFAVLGLLVVLQGSIALMNMAQMRTVSDEIEGNTIPTLDTLAALNLDMMRVRIFTFRLMLAETEQQKTDYQAALAKVRADVAVHQQKYGTLISIEGEREVYQQFVAAQESYFASQARLLQALDSGNKTEATRISHEELTGHSDKMTKALMQLAQINREHSTQQTALSTENYETSKIFVILAILVGISISIFIALWMTRSITAPMNEAVTVAETVASGDLTQKIAVSGGDEASRLMAALQKMQQNLRDAMSHISNSSDQLASAAEELNSVTEDSSRGLQQQNDEIQQAATAITEMSSAVDEVAQTAVQFLSSRQNPPKWRYRVNSKSMKP